MSRLEDNILQAIDIIVNKAVADAKYDKTIMATIVECVDKTIGKYKVKYKDACFYAYSENIDTTYLDGTSVYVLVPGNDMSRDKRIIGTTKKLGVNYIPAVEEEDLYDVNGKNCLTKSDSTFGLHSYKKGGEAIVLYDKDGSASKIGVNKTDLNEYIKQSNTIKIEIQVRTALTAEQQYRGDYGIIFSLNFKDNATGSTVTRNYVLDIDKMVGNPYKLVNKTKQYAIFDIDGENFIEVNYISIFCYNFVHSKDNPPEDIFISNIEFCGVNRLSDSDRSNYSLSIITPQGTYFDNSSIDSDIRNLEAQLRVKGNIVNYNSQKVEFYWFVQDVSIVYTSKYYNKYGGSGWRCLNKFNVLAKAEESQEDVIDWLPASSVWKVKKTDVVAKEVKYKCVAVYDNSVIYKEVTIKNYASSYDITITSNAGTQFYFDIGHPTLTCKVNGKTNADYSYAWAMVDNTGGFTTLPSTADQNKAYNDLKSQRDTLKKNIDSGAVPEVSNKDKLVQLDKELKKYDLIMRVDGYTLHDVQINTITNFATYQCSVSQKGVYLGMASITLSNNLQAEGAYTLVINDGAVVYKYNEAGVSPASKINEQPVQIKALTFTVYNNLGEPIEEDIIEHAKIHWTVPIVNTMLTIPNSYTPSVTNGSTATYDSLMSLTYNIKDRYNISYVNNTIQLTVEYKNMLLSAETNLVFSKEGEPGTNGTEFYCKIVPNVKSGAEAPLYPTVTILADGTTQWNYTPASSGVYFRVQLWHNEVKIFDAAAASNSTEGKQVSRIEWSIPLNKYRVIEEIEDEDGNKHVSHHTDTVHTDTSSFTIDKTTGVVGFKGFSEDNPVNIVQCSLIYESVQYFATIPIITVLLKNDNYRIKLKDYTGFRFAIYANDGRGPTYDRTNPFTLITTFNVGNNQWEDVSEKTAVDYVITYAWKYLGVGSYLIDNNMVTTTKSQKAVALKDNFTGESKSTALEGILSHASAEIGRIHIPIHLYLDTHGNAAVNGWDGNSVQLSEDGGFILAPQVGAGRKENDNSFTGLLMGVAKETYGKEEVGLFGYYFGNRTIFLDAETGKSEFGVRGQGQIVIDPSDGKAQIYSGNYKKGKSGLLIDLTTPCIEYGNGNFSVDADGNLKASSGEIGGWIIEKDGLRSSKGKIKLNADGSIKGPNWFIDEKGLASFQHLKLKYDDSDDSGNTGDDGTKYENDNELDLGCFYANKKKIVLGDFIIRHAQIAENALPRPAFFSLYQSRDQVLPDDISKRGDEVDEYYAFSKALSGISAVTLGDQAYWLWCDWRGAGDMAFGVTNISAEARDFCLTSGRRWNFNGQSYWSLTALIQAIDARCTQFGNYFGI